MGYGSSLCFPLTLSANVPVLFSVSLSISVFPSSAVSPEAEPHAGITQILSFCYLWLDWACEEHWWGSRRVLLYTLCFSASYYLATALKITGPGNTPHPPKLQLSLGAEDTLSSSVSSAVKIRASCCLKSLATLSSLVCS